MENNPDRREIARSNSWKTVEMPTERASLPFKKTFTAEEFSILSRGFIPQVMEHKWFIFMQDNILFFHRSWTVFCIFKVIFQEINSEYVVQEALVNQNIEQYNSTDNYYETALLSWLIDGFLLRKKVPFPLRKDLPKNLPSGLFQHHIAGTGFPEVQSEEKEEE